MKYNAHQSVKILTGKHETLVGTVLECRDATQMVKVSIQGTLNDMPVDEVAWLKFGQVEAL